MKKRTIRQNVEAILANNEVARGDDKVLLLAYWKDIDGINMDNFAEEFVLKGTIAESVRRQRQLIQADGLFLPSDEVLEARAKREMIVRESVRRGKMIS